MRTYEVVVNSGLEVIYVRIWSGYHESEPIHRKKLSELALQSLVGDLWFEVTLAVQRICHDKSFSASFVAGSEHAAVCRHVVIIFQQQDVPYFYVLDLTLSYTKAIVFEIVDDVTCQFIDALILLPALDFEIKLFSHSNEDDKESRNEACNGTVRADSWDKLHHCV